MATTTFYPDAHEETSSVDGYTARSTAEDTWAAIHDGAGTAASDTALFVYVYTSSGSTQDKWILEGRNTLVFDTSALGATANISAATLSFYGEAKSDGLSATPSLNVYSSNPASDTEVVAADHLYTNFGTTPFCDTSIAYADINVGDPGTINNFVFNAAGIAAISKTGVSKFAIRDNYDATDTPPTWVESVNFYIKMYSADKGAGYKPQLVVTYTPLIEKSLSDTVSISDSFSRTVDFKRAFTDSVTVADSISKAVSIVKAETIAIVDKFSWGWAHLLSLTDTVAITDSLQAIKRWIALTLRARSLALTLKPRTVSLTLLPRSLSLSLKSRTLSLTLHPRSLSLTLKEK